MATKAYERAAEAMQLELSIRLELLLCQLLRERNATEFQFWIQFAAPETKARLMTLADTLSA